MKRKLLSTIIGALCLGAIGSYSVLATNQAARAAADEIPTFKYDPDWPKPLPNGWTTGVIGAIYITKDDHIWLATRPSAVTASTETYLTDGLGECCAPAPPVMELDTAGNVVQAWGPIHMTDQKTRQQVLFGKQPEPVVSVDVWPSSEHAMFVDYKNNVWISSQSPPSQLLKFTRDGKFIKRFGTQRAARARTRPVSRAPRQSMSIPRPMRPTSATATGIAVSSCSMLTPAPSSACGEHMASRQRIRSRRMHLAVTG